MILEEQLAAKRQLSAGGRARNSLRPFFNPPKPVRNYWKQLQSIRQTTMPADYKEICNVVERNNCYPFAGMGSTFPTDPSRVPDLSLVHLKPLPQKNELLLQATRLNCYADKLSKALTDLASINRDIRSHDWLSADNRVADFRSEYGLSLLIMRKDLFLSLESGSLPGLAKRYKTLTSQYQNNAWALFGRFYYDLLDPTYDPIRATQRWLRIVEPRVDKHSWYASIMQDTILSYSTSRAQMATAALRFSCTSILDLLFLLWRKKCAHVDDDVIQDAFSHLDSRITDPLVEHFTTGLVRIPKIYNRLGEAHVSDTELFRVSFFFDELKSISEWRCTVLPLLFADYVSTTVTPSILKREAAQIASTPTLIAAVVDDLKVWEANAFAPSAEFQDQRFLTSLLVAECVRAAVKQPVTNGDELAELLASTKDIHLFVHTSVFEALLKSDAARHSDVLAFVIWEMIYRQTRTQDNELDRRLAFMRVIGPGQRFDTALAEIHKNSPNAAFLIAKCCSRTFLEKLFLLMASVKDVLETRLIVCKWINAHGAFSDESVAEEIESLDREIANLEARSDLDSTRVHVDEDSFREWFNTIAAASVRRYKDTVLSEGPEVTYQSLLTFFSEREKHASNIDDFTNETQIGSEFLLVAIVDSALTTFVSDRSFGLDAYLSRRIRHGTLSGSVITPINRVLSKMTELASLHQTAHQGGDVSGVDRFVSGYRSLLITALDRTRKDIIQIQSKEHPEGLIQAQWRAASNVQLLDAMIARLRERLIQTSGAYDIFPELFSFCWDCLETDLALLRRYMLRDFAPSMGRVQLELYDGLSAEERKIVGAYMYELQSTLEQRVREVCGWFIRPVFRHDRYSLRQLISTSLSIVRELDSEYAFKEKVETHSEITLNRGSFDVFGDALFVLLGNAARHGRKDGLIEVSAAPSPQRSGLVRLRVSSLIRSEDDYDTVVSRIESSFRKDDEAIAKAAVQEGSSGLMKLAGLMHRIRSAPVRLALVPDRERKTIIFDLDLPAEITVTRLGG